MIRAFIAVPLSVEQRDAVAALQRRLTGARGVKWVEPENFHFTLRFLGQVESTVLEHLRNRLQEGFARCPAFPIYLAGVGAFPSRRRPRTVWLGVTKGADELTALAQVANAATVAVGLPPEDRPFQAHLTLGRVKASPPSKELVQALENEAATEVGEMWVREVLLMRSDLRPTGPIYTALASFPLQANPATPLAGSGGECEGSPSEEQTSAGDDDEVRRAKDMALRWLSYQARSESEVRQRLRTKHFSEAVADRAVEDLRRIGLINDQQFAESWVQSRLSSGKAGRARLAWELRSHGIERQIVEQTLAHVSEEAEFPLALKLAQHRYERLRDKEPEVQRRRIASLLQRRGFSYETIVRALEEILPSD